MSEGEFVESVPLKYNEFYKVVGDYRSIKFFKKRKMINFIAKAQSLILCKIFHKKPKISFYKGSNWCSITLDAADFLIKNSKRIKCIFSKTFCGDELFIPTMLHGKFKVNNYNCRLIDRKRGMPYLFKEEDIDEILNSKELFARKINSEKNQLCNKLEEFLND